MLQDEYLTPDFMVKLVRLFSSPDPRERDYLKTIVHVVYGKCMQLRMLIRRGIIREMLTQLNLEFAQEKVDDNRLNFAASSYGFAE